MVIAKHIFITILLLLFSIGIKAQNPKTRSIKKAKKKKVTATIIAEQRETFTISGNVTQTFSYCGGVQPSEEMLENMAVPKPMVGKIFHIRKGKINTVADSVIFSFTTDKDGNFSLQLPPGIYSVIQNSQVKELNVNDYKTNKFITIDEQCLKNWWAKPYYILEIKDKDIKDLHFSFHNPCFLSGEIPCMQYIGPMPP